MVDENRRLFWGFFKSVREVYIYIYILYWGYWLVLTCGKSWYQQLCVVLAGLRLQYGGGRESRCQMSCVGQNSKWQVGLATVVGASAPAHSVSFT